MFELFIAIVEKTGSDQRLCCHEAKVGGFEEAKRLSLMLLVVLLYLYFKIYFKSGSKLSSAARIEKREADKKHACAHS